MRKHILLIEPDKILAQTYKKALEQAGYKVHWETVAQAGITSVDHALPILIILEVQLVAHNGIEFLYELRSYADWKDVPVVLLTGVPEVELGLTDEIKKSLGIIAYCYKPQTSLQQLLGTVKHTVA